MAEPYDLVVRGLTEREVRALTHHFTPAVARAAINLVDRIEAPVVRWRWLTGGRR